MNVLGQLTAYYKDYPAMALLRALEIEQFAAFSNDCAKPVLDLGCGDGYMAKLAFDHQVDAGFDINFKSLKEAAVIGAYRALINADARYLPFKDNIFRTVYSNSAMEHMDNLDVVLREIARVLIKEGILVTLVPSQRLLKPVGPVSRFLGQIIWDRFNRLQHHINLLDENQWISWFSEHGLRVKLIKPYCSYTIARYIFDLDLCGKLHFNFRWPFLHLRHRGNIGFMVTKIILRFLDLRRILSKYAHRDDMNYCFMIMVVKE